MSKRVSKRIELSALLEHVTSELIKSHEHAQKRGTAVMQFKECEIEFAVEAAARKARPTPSG